MKFVDLPMSLTVLINDQIGPECVKLKQYDELKPRRNYERNLQTHLKNLKPLDHYTLDLLDNLLTLDPTKRLTAT